MSKEDPPTFGVCMLWQPSHSATPPEWNAYEVVLKPTATRAAKTAKSVTFTTFISPPCFSPAAGPSFQLFRKDP
jgi:hypothetical protein